MASVRSYHFLGNHKLSNFYLARKEPNFSFRTNPSAYKPVKAHINTTPKDRAYGKKLGMEAQKQAQN